MASASAVEGVLKFADRWYGLPLWFLGLGVLPFLWGNVGPDPLLWRAQASSEFGGHHTLILLFISSTFFALVKSGIRPSFAAFSILYVAAVHEMEWWGTNTVSLFLGGYGFGWLLDLLTGWFFITCFAVVIFYPKFFRYHWKYLVVMAVFYAGWLSIGFPVTANFVQGVTVTGITSWYYVPWVNALELASWVFAMGSFYVLERKSVILSTFGISLLTHSAHHSTMSHNILRRMSAVGLRARHGAAGGNVVQIAVGLIIFATLGVAALGLLFGAPTTTWGTTVPTIAITVTAILASLAVALSFFSGTKGGL